jgi:ADP-ribose pyrophosphatase
MAEHGSGLSESSQFSDVPVLGRQDIVDEPSHRQIHSRSVLYQAHVQTLVREEFSLNPEVSLTRDFIEHPGAVVVAALNERSELLMIRQYRHPARLMMWELPAGLLDIAGERPEVGAPRELAEEADMTAAEWHTLADFHNSAGGSNEACRIYLARGLAPVADADRHIRDAEESEIRRAWVPVEEAVAAVFAGTVHNTGAAIAILAVDRWLRGGVDLRPVDAPWTVHPKHSTWV